MKVSDLIDLALDWAVAKCKGVYAPSVDTDIDGTKRINYGGMYPEWSTDWAQGGPIIEQQEIGIRRNAPCSQGREWEARPSSTAKGAGGRWGYGPTPLIAAMRCYVASTLGDEIDIPEELI